MPTSSCAGLRSTFARRRMSECFFCDAENAPFYERLDWSALPRGRALVEGEIPDGVLMILGDDLIAPDPIRLPWVW
jgi:hypothetical protein